MANGEDIVCCECVSNGFLDDGKISYVVEPAAPVMHGHVPTFAGILAIREELIHEFVEAEAPLLENPCLPVLCEHDVFG